MKTSECSRYSKTYRIYLFIRWREQYRVCLDFDGIVETVVNVSAYRDYENVMNELCKHYAASTVERFLYDNFVEHISF